MNITINISMYVGMVMELTAVAEILRIASNNADYSEVDFQQIHLKLLMDRLAF